MSKSFDFVVKAKKVVIKKQGDHKYKVKLAGISDFLKYQAWSKNNINGDHSVSLVSSKDWVKNNFTSSNNFQPSFTPTTIMEVGNTKYCFVIENATYNNKNKKYNTVFNVSTNQIVRNNISKHLLKLPINKKLNNVRFDIDSSSYITVTLPIQSIIPSLSSYGVTTTGISLTFTYNLVSTTTPGAFPISLNGQTPLTATAPDPNSSLYIIQAFISNFYTNYYYYAETKTITLYDVYVNGGDSYTIVLG